MTRRRVRAVLALALVAASRPVSAGGFVVLVNRTNAIASISRADLKRTISGALKQWDNGAVVQLGVIAGDAPETRYLASLLDMTPRELMARIQEQVFKGELRRPVLLRSSADCGAFARSKPGALCIAAEGEPLPPEVRAVPVR
jgi:hypothetical protein